MRGSTPLARVALICATAGIFLALATILTAPAAIWFAPAAIARQPAETTPRFVIGDAGRGAKVFEQCMSCHMVGSKAENGVGPHLNELFGRRAGGVSDYEEYSESMRRLGADGLFWSAEYLDIYIENPLSLVSRTTMSFDGIADRQRRLDLLAFLRAYSANPRDIPESAPTAPPSDPDVAPQILAIAGDPAYGEYLAGECTTCHRQDGADEGIPSITGWPVKSFVVAMHAYKSQARPHPVMRMVAGSLADEEIAALASYFATLKP